jgi:hypothetical protein
MDPTASPASPARKTSSTHRRLFLAIAGVLLAVVIMPLLQWRQVSSQALRELLRAELTRVSDSVYVLQISPVRLRLFPGSISFDSAYVTTDTLRKTAYPNRPVLRLAARGCQFSGVDVWKLLRKQGLYGSLFRCDAIRIGAQVAATDSIPKGASAPHGKSMDFLTLQRDFRLPAELPVIKIEDVEFPDIRLDLTRHRTDLPTQRVALQRFSAHFEDVIIDPQVPASERRPLFSKQIALAAEELAIGSGDETVSFKHMAADLDEGSFTLVGLEVQPGDTAATWFRRQPWRKPWVKLVADSVRFAGIDLASLIRDGKVVTERIVIGGLDATIETDASLPPRPPTAAAPISPVHEAASVAATGVRLEADVVQLVDGTVRYTEHRPDRPATTVWLPNFAFEAGNILIDPQLPPAQQRPLLAKVLALNLDGATYLTSDSLQALTFGQLRLMVGDSLLVARKVSIGPALSDAAWMRRQKLRHTLGRATIDSLVMLGVDFNRLVVHSALSAREMAVGGVRVRLQKDMGLPAPPRHEDRTTPALDSALADLGVPTHIGRLSAQGDITYVEHHHGLPDREFLVRKVAVSGERLAVGDDVHPAAPLLAQRISLVLTDVDRHWGATRSLAVGRVALDFRDSTITVDSIRIAPHFSPGPHRTRVTVGLDTLRFNGVDFVRLADGHGGSMRQAIIGNASIDVKVDAGVPAPVAMKPEAPPDTAFSGLDFPLAIRDLQVRKGHGLFTQVAPGKAPVVLTVGRLSASGTALRLQRAVTRPLIEQDLVLSLSEVTLSDDSLHAQLGSARVALADSTISLRGISLRTGAHRGVNAPASSGVVVGVDSVQLAGLHLAELVRGRAARAGKVTVGTVDLEVHHVASTKDSAVAEPDREAGQKQGLPVSVAELRVPVVHVRYVDQKKDGKQSVITVKKAGVFAEGVSFSPGASHEARVRHVSRHATIKAEGIVLSDNPMSTFTIGSVAASVADSSAHVTGIYIGPTVSDSVWASKQVHRTDRIRFTTDSVVMAGLDFDRLLLGDGFWVRQEKVFGFDIDVFTDKNLKPNPAEKKHSSAQTDVQSIKFPFGIDTVSVIDGQVVYHELEVGKPEPGVVSFTAITATITGFTSRGVAGKSPPLRIETHSTLFGMGKLDAYATVPLTDSGFDATYHGRLGPMPAVAVNQYAEKSLPVTIEGGQFEEVTFSVRSVNGHATGNITPVYRDLRVRVHDKKAGFFKRLEYSVVTFLAREFFIRHDNPAKEGRPPRVGAIDHTFAGESIVQFLWFAVRDGIEKSILK